MDEATIRIRMDGGRHPGPGGASGSAPGAAPPPAGTARGVQPPPAARPIDVRPIERETANTLDVVATMARQMQLQAAGIFGSIIGSGLQFLAAWQQLNTAVATGNAKAPEALSPQSLFKPAAPGRQFESQGPSPQFQYSRGVVPPPPHQHPIGAAPQTFQEAIQGTPETRAFGAFNKAAPPSPELEAARLKAMPAMMAYRAGERQASTPPPEPPLAAMGASEIAGAAAGPLAIVGAVVAGMVALKSVTLGAVDAMGSFATTISSPDSNPAQYFEAFGRQTTEATEKLIYIGNALGILGPAIGHASESFGRLMRNLDATAQRYEQYDARLATATALADVRQTLGDLRRSREVGPELGRYIDAQSQMQQKYEDLKVELLQQILPATTDAVKVATALFEVVKPMAPLLRIAVESSVVVQILRLVARLVGQNEEQLELPDPIGVTLEQRGIRVP